MRKVLNSNPKGQLSPDSPKVPKKGISEGILPNKKALRKLAILKIFSPRKYIIQAFREYLEKTPIGRSYFYRLVNELETEGYLIHVGGRSPREMKVVDKALDRLSLLLGIPTSKGNIPDDTSEIVFFPVGEPRLHNILFVVPIFCPTSWFNAEMKKEGWTINMKAGNLRNVSHKFEDINATNQFFRTSVLIRLRDVIGSNAYVNSSVALDQFNEVIDRLEKMLPNIRFYRDQRKYESISKNPPMMYFENGLPGHPIPNFERKIGIRNKTVLYNNGRSKLFSDNSVGPELDFIGDDSCKDTQKSYDDLIYTFQTGVGVPELHDQQLDHSQDVSYMKDNLSEMIELQSRISDHVKKNKELIEGIKVQQTRDLEKELSELKRKMGEFTNKPSLFKRIRQFIGI